MQSFPRCCLCFDYVAPNFYFNWVSLMASRMCVCLLSHKKRTLISPFCQLVKSKHVKKVWWCPSLCVDTMSGPMRAGDSCMLCEGAIEFVCLPTSLWYCQSQLLWELHPLTPLSHSTHKRFSLNIIFLFFLLHVLSCYFPLFLNFLVWSGNISHDPWHIVSVATFI